MYLPYVWRVQAGPGSLRKVPRLHPHFVLDRLAFMVNCMRCNVPLVFQGMKEFHGEINLIAEGKLDGALYICPECGAIELFDPEIGTEKRADNPMNNVES